MRSTIDRIVENGVTTLDNEVRYPKHPRDEELEDWAGMSHYIGTGGVLWAPDYLCKERDAAVGESWLIANLTAFAEHMEAVFNKTPLAADVPMMFRDLPIAMQLLELTGESRFDAKTPKWFTRPFTNVQHSRKLRHPGDFNANSGCLTLGCP